MAAHGPQVHAHTNVRHALATNAVRSRAVSTTPPHFTAFLILGCGFTPLGYRHQPLLPRTPGTAHRAGGR